MEHFSVYEELIKDKYPDHVNKLSEKLFYEVLSPEIFAHRYLTHVLKGAECKYV